MLHRNLIMRIVAVGLLLYALLRLVSVYGQWQVTEREAAGLETELAQLSEERKELEAKLDPAARESEMRRLAWERLGMVMPGEKIFYFVEEEEATGQQKTERNDYGAGSGINR